jgi:hypothetical protein
VTSSPQAATPQDFLHYADSYLSAAGVLYNQPAGPYVGADAHHLLPALYLLSLCIELTLKGFILNREPTFDRIQQMDLGHDLLAAFQRAQASDLFEQDPGLASPAIANDINYLNDRYERHQLRYPTAPLDYGGEFSRLTLAKHLLLTVARACGVTGLRVQSADAVQIPASQFRVENVAVSGSLTPRVIPPFQRPPNSEGGHK